MKVSNTIGVLVIAAALATVACDGYDDNDSTTATPPTSSPPNGDVTPRTTPPPPASPSPAPDNTEQNRDDTNPTALDQGQSASDVRITAEIRRAIMDDTAMSTSAKNCKVITLNGVVTLRGPVATQAEKDAIGAKAKAIAGVTRVDNQLEVNTP